MSTPSRRYRAHSWTPALRKRFIESLAMCGQVRRSVAICGLSRQSVYRLRSRDPEFALEWDAALGMYLAELRQENLAELARSMEARLAAGRYDLQFFDLLIEIAGEDLRAMVDPRLLPPRDRNSCDAVSTAVR